MNWGILAILFITLINVIMVIHQKRLRRLAAARLEVVETITRMERMMLDGKIRQGNVLHDQYYRHMRATQYGINNRIRWRFWEMTPTMKEIREELKNEFSKKSELSNILAQFAYANFREFRNRHPFSFMAFCVWVLFCAGGLVVLLGGLLCLFGISHLKKTIQEGILNFKRLVMEYYASYRLASLRIG